MSGEEPKYEDIEPLYRLYYNNSYPYDKIFRWLSYDKTIDSRRREWSYEGLSADGQDFIRRFVNVENANSLFNLIDDRSDIKLKFDIGPLYTEPMEKRNENRSLVPEERELVFDIDADDFANVRKCCSGKKMCNKCWRFMECALCILCHFCQVYGYNDYMFVFSGRRGMHCWICDKKARRLTAAERQYIIQPFDIIAVDNENQI